MGNRITNRLILRGRVAQRGFSLAEILVVIGIIGMLVGLLLPAIARARESAKKVQCASNLHNISIAVSAYVNEWKWYLFWRGNNVALEGVEFYVYGGKETNNSAGPIQAGLFNNTIRPLNPYMSRVMEAYHCPSDSEPVTWAGNDTNYNYVGTSYVFNCTGNPGGGPPGAGFAGKKITRARDTSDAIMFFEACLLYDKNWHPNKKGNILLADGHVVFDDIPTPGMKSEFHWGIFN